MPRQHLTPNACLVCRKKRTKCDGQMPCRRCRSRGEECAYEDKKWRTKDHLRSEIERLRNEQRQGHAVIRALINDEQGWQSFLSRIQSDESPEAIADWIRSMRNLLVPLQTAPSQSLGTFGRLDGAPPRLLTPSQPTASSLGSDSSQLHRAASFSGIGSYTFPQARVPFDHPTPRSSFSSDLSPTTPTTQFSFREQAAFLHAPQPLYPLSRRVSSPALPSLSLRRSSQPLAPGISNEPLPRTWTSITSDALLVERLLSKFFSAPCSLLCFIQQSSFMKAFREGRYPFWSTNWGTEFTRGSGTSNSQGTVLLRRFLVDSHATPPYRPS